MTDPVRPDIDTLWDYSDPAATEARMRIVLADVGPDRDSYWAVLMTQIARAQGLQQRFDDARTTLDEVEGALGSERAPRVRYLLERGRVANSDGRPADSLPLFEEALDLAADSGLDALAVDAAHMLGIAANGQEALDWNEQALEIAEGSDDPGARRWRGALYNNLGWTYHDLGRHDAARSMFERYLDVRREQGNEEQVGIALWSIAKMDRLLGLAEEALAAQMTLLERSERQGNDSEGYTREEIGECLLELGRLDEAKPHFARAFDLLRSDPWLSRDEPDRLARLKRLSV